MQPVPPIREISLSGERPLSTLLDDVLRSAREVAEQSAVLARLEIQQGVRRGAIGVGLLVAGSVFLGILAALLWVSLLGALVWLAGDRIGVPATILALCALHAVAAVVMGLGIRSRLTAARAEAAE